MFGHSDNRSSGNAAANDGMLQNEDTTTAAAALVTDMTSNYPPTDLPTPTATAATTAPEPVVSTFMPSTDASPVSAAPAITPAVTDSSTAPAVTQSPDELLDIKQQALQHLSPLVDHLEQSPSDRFRTTMMMIQAADNSALIKNAYDAALGITDDKERAQALLDLVNEINYFTQKNNPAAATTQA